MKNKIIYISILIFTICISFVIYKLIVSKNINEIYESLVYIESMDDKTITSGSGFVYKVENNKNYIVTNYHVINGYSNIYVYNIEKKKARATVINYDEKNDIAILIINNELGLKEANIIDSSKIKRGDNIYVVGTPISIENFGTITIGKVLDVASFIDESFDFKPIKVSAKTNYGNSGGPLLNKDGEVIGMMFLKDKTNDNESFAIPINFVLEDIKKIDDRPSLGATMTNTSNINLLNKYNIDVIDINGVVILEVNEKGILFDYDIKQGDIIISINGFSVNNVSELRDELYKYNKGDNIEIEYLRGDSHYSINVKI